jgi:hypothetical protein
MLAAATAQAQEEPGHRSLCLSARPHCLAVGVRESPGARGNGQVRILGISDAWPSVAERSIRHISAEARSCNTTTIICNAR